MSRFTTFIIGFVLATVTCTGIGYYIYSGHMGGDRQRDQQYRDGQQQLEDISSKLTRANEERQRGLEEQLKIITSTTDSISRLRALVKTIHDQYNNLNSSGSN